MDSFTLKNIRDSYRETLTGMYGRAEAEALFYWVAEEISGKKRVEIIATLSDPVGAVVCQSFLSVLERLKKGEPVQYIFGKAYFRGLTLEVNPSVLIPRGETEELVAWACTLLAGKEEAKILDLCTGSGAIAIALATAFPQAEVYACDISEEALQTALRNNESCRTAVRFFRQDVLVENLSVELGRESTFDLVISNPPYVLPAEKARMRTNVLAYEPYLALFVDPSDPLQFYRAVARHAARYLKPGGVLLAEINEALPQENLRLLEENGFVSVEIREDLHGKARMVKGNWQKME